jgi:cobalamin biosynthesis protein CobD/CbiB
VLSGDKCEDSPFDVAAYVSALRVRSLTVKAEGACQAWQQGDVQAARGKLSALLHEVRSQRGGKLEAPVADTLAEALTHMVGAL